MSDAWRRIFLTIEYDGTRYAGWQRQLNAPSVQGEIEKVLFTVEKRYVPVYGASRTDAGVHALGQVAHFDTRGRIPVNKYPFVFNSMMPEDISVRLAREVPPAQHARFSARGKTYTFRIDNRRHACALKRRFYAHVPLPLNESSMRQAAQALLGTHDFAAFASAESKAKTTVRTLKQLDVQRQGEDIILTVTGNAFLYNMVRIMAGSLIYVGLGRMDTGDILRALEEKNRLLLGPTADACGLELTRVYYEDLA